MKKILAIILALCMMAALAACGDSTNPTNTQAPAASETPATTETPATEAPAASLAGTYKFDYTDVYGDVTSFTVTLKDGGEFTLMTLGAMGSGLYSGTEWTDNGDGSFTTGASDPVLDVDWAGDDGSVTWVIDGSNVAPKGYTAPTEFLEHEEFTDPTTPAEAAGVYTFAFVNSFGSSVPYVIWLNADGTATIYQNNSRTGLHGYYWTNWSINADSVVTINGTCTYDDDPPKTANTGDWFGDEPGYESTWKLSGDGTAVPTNFTGSVGEVVISDLPAEAYHPGAEKAGIYTFGFVNSFGSTVPYVLWINADGTANIYQNNARTGLHGYYWTEWTLNDDDTVTISGTCTYDDDAPKTANTGDWFGDEPGYESTWTLNANGTAVPTNFTGTEGVVDVSELPASIYPTGSVAGTYYFGLVNSRGSTVPYVVVLKDDGTALIVMDNAFTGTQSYTAKEWTDNGDGTVSIGALSYEGDPPKTANNGAWFADDTYESTWRLEGSTCVPVGYADSVASVSAADLSESAQAVIAAF